MSERIKVVQNGLGKMGSAALKRLLNGGIEMVGIADPDPSIEVGHKLARLNGITVRDGITEICLEPGAILVDFSDPAACRNAALYVANCKGKVLTGTTPLPSDIESELRGLADQTAVMVVPDFSPEINKFLKEMEDVALTITPEDYVNIYERHRSGKVVTSRIAISVATTFCTMAGKRGYILFLEGKAFAPDGHEIEMPDRTDADLIREYVLVSCERFGAEPGLHTVRIGNENDYRSWQVRATLGSYATGVEMAVRFVHAIEKGLLSFTRDVLKL